MECKDFRLNISAYIDNMLEEADRKAFVDHLERCIDCSLEYENIRMIVESIQEIDEVELPSQFAEEFRSKLQMEAGLNKDEKLKQAPTRKVVKRRILSGVAAGFAILLVSFSLLNNPSFMGMKTAETQERAMIMDASVPREGLANENKQYGIAFDQVNPAPSLTTTFTSDVTLNRVEAKAGQLQATENSRIRIKRGRLRLEVDNFDEVYDAIINTITAYDGYVQNSEIYQYGYGKEKPNQSLRYGNMTLRVPSQTFFASYETLKSFGVVTSHAVDEEDITERYRDIENEVRNLQIQEERLRELFQKGEKVEDLLKIENELSRIRLQINSLMGDLKNYDHLVSMSTIHLEIQEMGKEELRLMALEQGFWNKAKNNFINSINRMISVSQGLTIGVFGLLPPLAVIAPLAFLGVRIYKKLKRNRDLGQ